MSPNQQRIALAQWEGWKKEFIHGNGVDADVWIEPTCSRCFLAEIDALPCYLTDLNEVHRLEKKLSDDDFAEYRMFLYKITCPPKLSELGLFRSPQHERLMLSATAAQKCEAMIKALNLWIP